MPLMSAEWVLGSTGAEVLSDRDDECPGRLRDAGLRRLEFAFVGFVAGCVTVGVPSALWGPFSPTLYNDSASRLFPDCLCTRCMTAGKMVSEAPAPVDTGPRSDRFDPQGFRGVRPVRVQGSSTRKGSGEQESAAHQITENGQQRRAEV